MNQNDQPVTQEFLHKISPSSALMLETLTLELSLAMSPPLPAMNTRPPEEETLSDVHGFIAKPHIDAAGKPTDDFIAKASAVQKIVNDALSEPDRDHPLTQENPRTLTVGQLKQALTDAKAFFDDSEEGLHHRNAIDAIVADISKTAAASAEASHVAGVALSRNGGARAK